MNQAYIEVLVKLTQLLESSKYIVLGSIATLSQTSKIGYEREIHDLDLIVDKSLINIIRKVLISKGYTESTFIHPRMPFYKFLLKEVPDRYIRFYKGKIAIECHVTEFQFINNLLVIDLYPKIKVSISIEYITKSVYENVEFSTVNVNLLFIIKNFLNNTLGYFVRYKSLQRQIDLYYLSKLIDMNEVKNINNDSRLRIWRLSIKLPFFLIKMRSR